MVSIELGNILENAIEAVDKLVKQAGGHVAAHREAGIFVIWVDL